MQHLKFDVTPLEELSYYSQKFSKQSKNGY